MTAMAIQFEDLTSSFITWRGEQPAYGRSLDTVDQPVIERVLRAKFALEHARAITMEIIEIGLKIESEDADFSQFYFANNRIQSAWANLKNSVIPVSKEPYEKVRFLLEDLATPHAVEWDLSHLEGAATLSKTTQPYKIVLEFLKA